MSEVLEVEDLCVSYRGVPGISHVTMQVVAGQAVALLGPNGAGKSSVLRGISGTSTTTGRVVFEGRDITRWPSHRRARQGLAQVPQGGGVFEQLTVDDNLQLGALGCGRVERTKRIREIFEIYPRLFERRDQPASQLSGGERQMLAIGRALMGKPSLVLLDEPSLGLAPRATKEMFTRIALLKEIGVAMVIVDQNAVQALEVADYVYVLSRGALVHHSTAVEARASGDIVARHLGLHILPSTTEALDPSGAVRVGGSEHTTEGE